ncbi:hypothetical protein F4825DRAFT_420916 [Nemania diffusa]|nr:hypothetical protein F4825DRAFT_420916 [Nemania diffusa]
MVWNRTDSGAWTDEYDGAEKVFYSMSQAFSRHGREHGSVYAICKISTASKHPRELVTELRNAWKRLRFDFPALAVFEETGRKKYPRATAAQVEAWVRDTFWVDSASSASTVVSGIHLRKLPCLVFFPTRSEVLFHSSHWRIDALGTCMVMSRLFGLLSEIHITGDLEPPNWELEYQNLSPSLEDAYGSPNASTDATEAKAEEIRRRNFETAYPSVGLQFQGSLDTIPGLSQSQSLQLSSTQSELLIAACKAKGITITAAVHAACAAIVFDQASDQGCDSYSTVVSANLRRLLPPVRQNETKTGIALPSFACGTYVTGITHTLPRDSDFETRSRQLTTAYRNTCDDTAYMVALRSIYRVHGQALAGLATSRARPPGSNVTISSLGLLDPQYLPGAHGGVQVEEFHLGSAIMTRQPTLYIWTFRGRLTLSIDYNEAYYNTEMISSLLDSICMCLGKEIGLDLLKYAQRRNS